jgi:UPF0755 protein
MARDPRVDKLQRLRTERVTRASGGYYGTRATAYGNVRSGPRQRDMGRTLLSLVLFVVIMAVAIYLASQYIMNGYRTPVASNQQQQTVTVTIPQGESASQLATQLQDKGIVNSSLIFNLYLRFSGANWTAGPHTLHTGMSTDQVAQAIAAPVVTVTNQVTVTIYPGWRAEQVAQALADVHVATYASVMNAVQKGNFSQYSFLSGRPLGATLEGYLYPDTYNFIPNEGARSAIDRLLNNFAAKVSPQVQEQGKQTYGSFFKAMKMASIVQREAGTNGDVGLIASVYLNRLNGHSNQFPTLGADPTVQYALGHEGDWWPNVDHMNLKNVNSPFNTYQHPGLPPLPISEPTVATIEATVNPPTTQYFWFWHKLGSHSKSIFCTAQQGSQCAGTPQ